MDYKVFYKESDIGATMNVILYGVEEVTYNVQISKTYRAFWYDKQQKKQAAEFANVVAVVPWAGEST